MFIIYSHYSFNRLRVDTSVVYNYCYYCIKKYILILYDIIIIIIFIPVQRIRHRVNGNRIRSYGKKKKNYSHTYQYYAILCVVRVHALLKNYN